MEKFHIQENSVQETLVIPLYGRVFAHRKFPNLINDPTAEDIIKKFDYDFETKGKKMESLFGVYGALEVSQREYDLESEIKEYLKIHPKASVVNLGCGLDDLFNRVNNNECKGFNIDLEDVIKARNELLPPLENETNIICDLNDTKWFKEIPFDNGVIFVALGVFYYFREEQIVNLFTKMAEYFKGGVLAFDLCNKKGLKLMLKTWIKEAEIKDVEAYFGVSNPEKELANWSDNFKSISSKSYMNGYRKLDNIKWIYKVLNKLADNYVEMNMDKYIQNFLNKNPNGTIINVGCGMETTFNRNDNGKAIWYEIDLEEVTTLRKKALEPNERDIVLTYSMFDYSWLKEVKKSKGPYLIVSSGVFYYFEEKAVIEFLRKVKEIGDVEVIFDTVSKFGMKQTKKYMKQLGKDDALMYFYVEDVNDLLNKVGNGVELLDEHNYYEWVTEKSKFNFIWFFFLNHPSTISSTSNIF